MRALVILLLMSALLTACGADAPDLQAAGATADAALSDIATDMPHVVATTAGALDGVRDAVESLPCILNCE